MVTCQCHWNILIILSMWILKNNDILMEISTISKKKLKQESNE